jgi:hypothetical protein
MMVASFDRKRVEAHRRLEHRPDYVCPECEKRVVLHARINGRVIPHFKHKAKGECANGKGESPAHIAVKALLRDHYNARGHLVQLELRFPEIGNRRADVYVADMPAAFEVEFSQKEAVEFLAKCNDYRRGGLRSIWIFRQKNVRPSDIYPGSKVVISTSPVLDVIRSRRRPQGATAAFFVYGDNETVVFRGEIIPIPRYVPYDAFSGGGGFETSYQRVAWLLVSEVIRSYPAQPGTENAVGGDRSDEATAT